MKFNFYLYSFYSFLFLILDKYFILSNFPFSNPEFELSTNYVDIAHSDLFSNVEYENLNNLIFRNSSFLIWQGPRFDADKTVFFISIKKTLFGKIDNRDENGLILWFIKNFEDKNLQEENLKFLSDIVSSETDLKNNSNSSKIIESNSNNLFGVTKNFEGLGIKINEVNLISILNDKGANIEKTYFNEYYKNLDYKYKLFESDIPSSNYLNLRITFLNKYVYVEYLKENLMPMSNHFSNYELCLISEFKIDKPQFLISGGLYKEESEFIFENLKMSQISGLKNIKINNENNSKSSDLDQQQKINEEVQKINKILESKIQIIDNLTQDAFNNSKILKNIFDKIFNFEFFIKEINSLDRSKFDFEILKEIIESAESSKIDQENKNLPIYNVHSNSTEIYSPLSTFNSSNEVDVEKKLFGLVEVIRNLTFDKINFLKNDPRENLVKSLDGLKERQSTMNDSILEMYHSTLSALEGIKSKAEKMETYQTFQQFLFILIFINAGILFSMYKNIQEKDGKSYEKTELRMSV